eukprot:2429429-Lingulodinium_polyedra.AAC.1
MNAYLQQKAKALVAESDGRAVLFTYGSDCTPVKTRENYSATLESGKTILRKGSHGTELLVEWSFVETTTAGGEN